MILITHLNKTFHYYINREVIGTYSDLRQAILRRLLQSVSQIKSAKVYRAALWVIGEFSITTEDIDLAFTTIKESLGDTPFLEQTEVFNSTFVLFPLTI